MTTLRRRFLPLLLATFVAAVAPPAANAAILYSTMEQPNDVQGTNSDSADQTTWVAQSFTPTQGGIARVVSFFAQTTTGGGFAVANISIYSDLAGNPGLQLANGGATVGEVTGPSPTCVALNSTPTLATAPGTGPSSRA